IHPTHNTSRPRLRRACREEVIGCGAPTRLRILPEQKKRRNAHASTLSQTSPSSRPCHAHREHGAKRDAKRGGGESFASVTPPRLLSRRRFASPGTFAIDPSPPAEGEDEPRNSRIHK